MKKLSGLILCAGLVASLHIFADDKAPQKKQDPANIGSYTLDPFQGMTDFVFFAGFPAENKQEADKINERIKDCLSAFGKVVPSSLVVKGKNGDQIDFSGFASGCFFQYEMLELTDANEKKLGILQANLKLSATIEISRTKQTCMSVIWSQSYFLKAEDLKDRQDFVLQSLKSLLEKFQKEYKQVNNDKPVFNLYLP